MPFTVAIVGRPNVGKSTLFNRLVGKRLAIVSEAPGVTRDRRHGAARIGDLRFTVVDTAGLENSDANSLAGRMQEQTARAVKAADVVPRRLLGWQHIDLSEARPCWRSGFCNSDQQTTVARSAIKCNSTRGLSANPVVDGIGPHGTEQARNLRRLELRASGGSGLDAAAGPFSRMAVRY